MVFGTLGSIITTTYLFIILSLGADQPTHKRPGGPGATTVLASHHCFSNAWESAYEGSHR